MYEAIEKIKELYSLLQDELSRQVFCARLLCDIAPTFTNCSRLDYLRGVRGGADIICPPADPGPDWKRIFSSLPKEGKRLILYGSGTAGQKLARYLLADGIDFYAFVGRGAAAYPDGIMGKPVFTPEWLFNQGDDARVVIAAAFNNYDEIEANLKAHHFPESRILPYLVSPPFLPPESDQYFDFPQLYRKGTAFIDGGCFDGADSVRFAKFAGATTQKSMPLSRTPPVSPNAKKS